LVNNDLIPRTPLCVRLCRVQITLPGVHLTAANSCPKIGKKWGIKGKNGDYQLTLRAILIILV